MNKSLAGGIVAAALTIAFPGIADAKTLRVVASFDVLADVVKNVGGDAIELESLVPTGGDPHEFSPSPADARHLAEADVVFVDGFGLEGWMDRLIAASGFKGTPVVASEGIEPRKMEEDGKIILDPHVWNSAANVAIWVDNIERALTAADPDDAALFAANAKAYGGEVRALDAYAKAAFAAIPEDRRKVLTSHDAFGYFGREYGLTFLSPIGLSTDADPSASDVAALIRQIKAEDVRTYFFESTNDPRLVRQIAKATGAQPGGELYVEALSPGDGPAPTYLRMFKYNVDQVIAGLSR